MYLYRISYGSCSLYTYSVLYSTVTHTRTGEGARCLVLVRQLRYLLVSVQHWRVLLATNTVLSSKLYLSSLSVSSPISSSLLHRVALHRTRTHDCCLLPCRTLTTHAPIHSRTHTSGSITAMHPRNASNPRSYAHDTSTITVSRSLIASLHRYCTDFFFPRAPVSAPTRTPTRTQLPLLLELMANYLFPPRR